MKWADGKIVSLTVKSTIGGNLRLRTATALCKSDGTQLASAQGANTNPLMQPYGMPDPIVKDQSKIPATKLADTYLYDIPTEAGQEITLVSETSWIKNVSAAGELPINNNAYNLGGQLVSDSYHGIVVLKGKKYIK